MYRSRRRTSFLTSSGTRLLPFVLASLFSVAATLFIVRSSQPFTYSSYLVNEAPVVPSVDVIPKSKGQPQPDPQLWKPLQSKCVAPEIIDLFPPDFDQSVYREKNKDKVSDVSLLDLHHYQTVGREKGWLCSRGQEMRSILNSEIVPKIGKVLEIGPFLRPLVKGKNVKYFDVLDYEGLKARAKKVGYRTDKVMRIHYTDPSGDLRTIKEKNSFHMVVSAHTLEHQLDLVRHLKAVGDLLVDGGYYTMIVPDKRYCFDHFIAESSIADVLDDYYENRYSAGAHKLKSVIEHRALTAHNDRVRHWRGDDGLQYTDVIERIKGAIAEYENGKKEGKYVDVHNYQFTPQSLAFLVDTLYGLELTDLHVHRLYETVANTFEFSIVLKQCSSRQG